MCIIAISEQAFSGGQVFAETLAQRLGFRYIRSSALVERAAAWGADRERLRRMCEEGPRFLDRFVRSKHTQVLQLQAALAQEVQGGSVVCYGLAADLLTLEATRILRICVQAPHRSRRLELQEHMSFHGAEAERYLNECDRTKLRWLTYLFGTKADLALGSDLVINLEQTNLDAACDAVLEMIGNRDGFGTADLGPIQNWALCTNISAAVAQDPQTRHLDLEVKIEGDAVVLAATRSAVDEGAFPLRFAASMVDSMRTALAQFPGTQHLRPQVTINGDALLLRGIVQPANEPIMYESAPASAEAGPARVLVSQSERHARFSLRHGWLQRLTWPLRIPHGRRALLHPENVAIVAAAIVLLAMIYGAGSRLNLLWHSRGAPLQTFAGVITDSNCGKDHKHKQLSAECVRSCVKLTGAKYVFDDGTHSFVLGDQSAGEKFAGRQVVASGTLEKSTGALRLNSIHVVEHN